MSNPTKEHNVKAIVLLVDDQPMVAEGIRRMLVDESDIVFHYCQDPAKAVETAIELQATTVLQDLVMPDVDGMTLVRFFRAHPETKDIPVIVLSSKEDPKVKSDAFGNGASDYLVKLPDRIELVARIRAHSKNYRTQLERDAAYHVMREMQSELENANAKLEETNRELQRLSSMDGLTGIANRRCFDEFLERELKRASRERRDLSLILIDIDFFKLFNDTYGHQAGDECLKSVAAILAHTVHRPTDLVARYGGEEFAAVLSETPLQGAVAVAEKMRTEIDKLAIPHGASQVSGFVTLSLGIAVAETGNEPETLIASADKALYRAKENGRNRVETAGTENPD